MGGIRWRSAAEIELGPDKPGHLNKMLARQKGAQWESIAEQFLISRGLTTVERNFNCRVGEIDLVMCDASRLVFIEVRYRSNDGHGSGAESVHYHKQRRLAAAARRFLLMRRQFNNFPCRFDVVSIGREEGRDLIHWIRNAFSL